MFERLLKKIAIQLKKGAIPYMVIGEQAVLLYGVLAGLGKVPKLGLVVPS